MTDLACPKLMSNFQVVEFFREIKYGTNIFETSI